MFDPAAPTADYALAWPRAVFRAEATALAGRYEESGQWLRDAVWLLEDAFAVETPARDLQAATSFQVLKVADRALPIRHDHGTGPARTTSVALDAVLAGLTRAGKLTGDAQLQYLQYLIRAADQLPEHRERAYWDARQEPGQDLGLAQVQFRWAALVEELQRKGYLARVAPPVCVRAKVSEPPPDWWLNRETVQRLGLAEVWPLQPGDWGRDTFLSLVEMVHDLVARPGRRIVHNHRDDTGWCGWHFDRYSIQTGQAVYRWQVDRLLSAYRIGLRFAETGSDAGRLVHVTGDDRDQMVHRVLATPEANDRDAVEHAVALFRARAATREDKRSAVVALARVLEDRRKLLKAELFRKDEGALFQIANEFDLRHRDAGQQSDYDEAFLDWVFWWYLATVELTDQLLARQS